MKRWDPEMYGPVGKCWRCGKPIEAEAHIYFSGPAGEPAHAECESDAVSGSPTDYDQILEVLGKKAKDSSAEFILRIGSLDVARQAAREWVVTYGKAGEGSAKVLDLYDQLPVYEVNLNPQSELTEVPILQTRASPRLKQGKDPGIRPSST